MSKDPNYFKRDPRHVLWVEHLDTEEMNWYCRGAADDASVQRIERHLLDCADCARRVYETVRELVRQSREPAK